MDPKIWAPKLFTIGSAVLVVALLANNAMLHSDPNPAVSWGPAEVTDGTTVIQATFQVDVGDRLRIDNARALFNLGLRPSMAGVTVALFETAEGDPGPDITGQTPVRSYAGELVSEAPRGTFLFPDPPEWSTAADSWLTYVVTIEHGGYRPPAGTARSAYASEMAERLVDDGPFGPSGSPYQVLPRQAIVAQPFFYAVEALAVAAILAGAGMSVRRREAPGPGLEGRLALATKAQAWLLSLRRLLWVVAAGLLGLAVLVGMLLAGAELALRPALSPDPFYNGWMISTLVGTLLLSAVGLAILILRVHAAARSIPALELDA